MLFCLAVVLEVTYESWYEGLAARTELTALAILKDLCNFIWL
jgi:hypothetical protein